jgi:hypothetical protein
MDSPSFCITFLRPLYARILYPFQGFFHRLTAKVGVAIFKNLKNPTVKSYSQPAMQDEETLSYLVLERAYDPKQGSLSLPVTGVGSLLKGGTLDTIGSAAKRVNAGVLFFHRDIRDSGGVIFAFANQPSL